ncbi:C40 family peptidase [Nocardioides cynanchi]|uniref:C40 family peptidase n=1 Tax=Nocardioides cynanchi TaxID=2558918 RepID=UPI0012454F47|nr:C40 family peptidase [Nocardioides cynanchi]
MRRSVGRVTLAALVAALLVGSCAADRTSADPGSSDRPASTVTIAHPRGGGDQPPLAVGHDAWVSVSVATLWRSPSSPRAVDAPALTRPARIETWLADLTLAERRGLSGRADTQALLGDRVRVLALPPDRPGWARVVVPSQPTPADPRGYPGWVPRRQLTARPPTGSAQVATVVVRIAELRTDDAGAVPLFPISFGTSLPVVGITDGFVRVMAPSGRVRRIAGHVVVVHPTGSPARAPTRASLVHTAEQFLGLPYLWAGASGFGLDCSGLTWLDYRVHGIRIPRDAEPQSQHGTSAARPRPGDLLFYATNGLVHHVSMYVGNGLMVHSPHTGARVQVIATATTAYQSEYVGSRRYLP